MTDHGPHRHPHLAPLRLSLMAQSALIRVAGVSGLIVVLWGAIWWAVALP